MMLIDLHSNKFFLRTYYNLCAIKTKKYSLVFRPNAYIFGSICLFQSEKSFLFFASKKGRNVKEGLGKTFGWIKKKTARNFQCAQIHIKIYVNYIPKKRFIFRGKITRNIYNLSGEQTVLSFLLLYKSLSNIYIYTYMVT